MAGVIEVADRRARRLPVAGELRPSRGLQAGGVEGVDEIPSARVDDLGQRVATDLRDGWPVEELPVLDHPREGRLHRPRGRVPGREEMVEEDGRPGSGGRGDDAVPDLAGQVVELSEAVDVREGALRHVEVTRRIRGSRLPAFRRRLVHITPGTRRPERALERLHRRAVGVVDRRIAQEDAERDLLGPVAAQVRHHRRGHHALRHQRHGIRVDRGRLHRPAGRDRAVGLDDVGTPGAADARRRGRRGIGLVGADHDLVRTIVVHVRDRGARDDGPRREGVDARGG